MKQLNLTLRYTKQVKSIETVHYSKQSWKHEWAWPESEISVRSPRTIFIFIIKKCIFRIKVTKINQFNFEKDFSGLDPGIGSTEIVVRMVSCIVIRYREGYLYLLNEANSVQWVGAHILGNSYYTVSPLIFRPTKRKHAPFTQNFVPNCLNVKSSYHVLFLSNFKV